MNAVNASGVDIIDPDASYSLTSVTDAFGNPINAFELVDNNDGTFFIKTKNNQAPEQLYVGQNIQETTYTFNVNCIVNYINNNFSFVGQLSNINPAANNIDATWEVTTGTVAVPLYIGSLIDHGDIDLGVSYNGTNFTSDITNGSKILPVSGRTNPQANINQYSELNLNVLRVENFYDQTDYTSLVNPRIIRTKTGDTSLNQINNRDNSSSGLAIEFATPSGISVSELSYLTVHCRLRDGGNLFIDFDFDLIVNT